MNASGVNAPYAVAAVEPSESADGLRAEFYLCLARAFLPPATEPSYLAMRDQLAGDLTEIVRALGYPVEEDLATYREAVSQFPSASSLLELYSRLFLVPGDSHPSINAATYLDGAVYGETVLKLMDYYARCGLEKRQEFADLPDHVAVQLEFAAWLFAAEAAGQCEITARTDATPHALDFLRRFVVRWAVPLRRDIEAAGARFRIPANPWLALARILETASARDAGIEPKSVTRRPDEELSEIERLRRQYANRPLEASDLATIRARLAERGLANDHVSVPAPDRDAAHGLTPLRPPEPERHHRKTK